MTKIIDISLIEWSSKLENLKEKLLTKQIVNLEFKLSENESERTIYISSKDEYWNEKFNSLKDYNFQFEN